jgi:hypothetical protein
MSFAARASKQSFEAAKPIRRAMKIIKIGIASLDAYKARTLAIARMD